MSGKIKAVFFLSIMFGLGLAAGVAWQTEFHHRPHGFRPFFADRRIHKLSSRLNLSPTQEQEVRIIFQKAHLRATQVNERVSTELSEIHRDTAKAIQAILNPEQQRAFEKMHDRFHKRHQPIAELH